LEIRAASTNSTMSVTSGNLVIWSWSTLALLSTQLLSSLLYGVTAADPATFAAVATVLAAGAAGAAFLPARRATRISAATALRAAD
jgi:ABC-type lipoprotein release transport system permease subunit